jgi:hypothetical protein
MSLRATTGDGRLQVVVTDSGGDAAAAAAADFGLREDCSVVTCREEMDGALRVPDRDETDGVSRDVH